MKPAVLVILYLVAALLPLVVSWTLGWPPRPWHQELAGALGMLAFAMILIEFVLSGRFRGISNVLGMDVTMRFHQVMARTAMVFALLHPFFYQGTPTAGPRPWDPTRQLTVTTDFVPLSSGILAFLLLPCLVLFSINRDALGYRYERWRLFHGLGALTIAGLLLHHVLEAGRYGAAAPVRLVWIGLTGLAAATLVWVWLVAPLMQRRRRWLLSGITRVTPHQWRLRLTPEGHDGLAFRAGQFAWLNLGHGPFSLAENPFSIASAPADGPDVAFLVKELGDFTRSLDRVRTGTRAYLDGPFGQLTVDARTEPGIWLIAGGVGIAPMLGLLGQLNRTADRRARRVIYGNRVAAQIVTDPDLADADCTYVLSEPPPGWSGETGMIDAALLDRLVTDEQAETWLFVLCGPAPMMDAVESALIARGTPSHRILSERFDYD